MNIPKPAYAKPNDGGSGCPDLRGSSATGSTRRKPFMRNATTPSTPQKDTTPRATLVTSSFSSAITP
eukprot:CAMPEP_0204057444 /NCGR_PEP_ID=MMETSP0360-20130528/134135_1 /ASSEMBLY_ACC=CAM_ASM_000342 /TAXON_ID=268821 /ORGANISM="Scrippsiella Hangoei, Strain SHTV-5" /LENGTH=66 /DNA_ID=CAMNT_0051004923 /DNA_START=35 /DNA_END=232 /DNA_ORIENTATION=+